jgi:hypothetical protein
MNRFARIFALATLTLAVFGCEARTDKSDGGGVLLSISDFDGLPTAISASAAVAAGQVTIGQITVQSVIKNPSQSTSELMTVEIESYEVTFQRDDTGTRIPPRLKNFVFGSVDAGGTFTLENGPIMRVDQLVNQPIRDMAEFGEDPETDSVVIRLKVGIQFFGRTISGDTVESAPAFFTLEVFP